MNNYLFKIIGEDPVHCQNLQRSTISRIKAFAIAIHIPVLIWSIVSFLISVKVFHIGALYSAIISFIAAGIIYLVERIVLASPKGLLISVIRLILGFIIGFLGASAVDLVIFNKEINHQLRKNEIQVINFQTNEAINSQQNEVNNRYQLWQRAKDAAKCEANGTCGTGKANLGPVYKELNAYAEIVRQDYLAAQNKLDQINQSKNKKIEDSKNYSVEDAGLLIQIEALHNYISQNRSAKLAYLLFFLMILSFELVTIFVKSVFKETADDHVERARESIIIAKAERIRSASSLGLIGAIGLVDD